MNKKSLVYVSIILIGFLTITSLSPKVLPGDVFAQEEPNMPMIPLSENIIELIGQDDTELLDNEILFGNANWSPAGITF